MFKVAIGGFDYEGCDLDSISLCDSDDYELPNYDYTEVITFKNDGRYIVAGYVVYEGCFLESIKNFNTLKEADDYGKTLISNEDIDEVSYDYYDVIEV
jgi:hypothetical protein